MAVELQTFNGLRDPKNSWALWSDAFPLPECLCSSPRKIAGWLHERTDELKPNVVFLGFNATMEEDPSALRPPTDRLSSDYQSFHIPYGFLPDRHRPDKRDPRLLKTVPWTSRDGRLKEVVQNRLSGLCEKSGNTNLLLGGFMSDLIAVPSAGADDVRRREDYFPVLLPEGVNRLSALVGRLSSDANFERSARNPDLRNCMHVICLGNRCYYDLRRHFRSRSRSLHVDTLHHPLLTKDSFAPPLHRDFVEYFEIPRLPEDRPDIPCRFYRVQHYSACDYDQLVFELDTIRSIL